MAGKSFQDRELASEVRSLALTQIKRALENSKDEEFKKAILLRLSTTILPRLNEVSGPDGKPIPILNVHENDSDEESSEAEETN